MIGDVASYRGASTSANTTRLAQHDKTFFARYFFLCVLCASAFGFACAEFVLLTTVTTMSLALMAPLNTRWDSDDSKNLSCASEKCGDFNTAPIS